MVIPNCGLLRRVLSHSSMEAQLGNADPAIARHPMGGVGVVLMVLLRPGIESCDLHMVTMAGVEST